MIHTIFLSPGLPGSLAISPRRLRRKPANINIYFMFYICFRERERERGGEWNNRVCVRYPCAWTCTFTYCTCVYVCTYMTSWCFFHEIDDANAMTLRIPGDERSFRLEQGNLSEYARELLSSLLELFKGRIFTVVSRRFIGISYSCIHE